MYSRNSFHNNDFQTNESAASRLSESIISIQCYYRKNAFNFTFKHIYLEMKRTWYITAAYVLSFIRLV